MNIAPLVLALGAAVMFLGGLVQAIAAGIELLKHPGRSKQKKKWLAIILVCIVGAGIFGFASYRTSSAQSDPSSPTPNTTTTTGGNTSRQTQSPTVAADPGASATLTAQASPTVTNGTLVKNLALTCNQCPSDGVHVTISSFQIDTANGRMVWDTALRDVTGSGSGFGLVEYQLQASGSTTPVNAVLPQIDFYSTNQVNTRAIFPFVPSPGVAYTLTIVLTWHNTNISLDPTQITF